MIYLIVQIFILLLLAGLLGLMLGWYLTRISAANVHANLRDRLRTVEGDARELRAELDAMTTAKSNADIERRLLSDELADMRARQDAAERSTDSDASIAALQRELEQCRESLVAAAAGGASEKGEHEADSAAIASAAAAAASGARGLWSARACQRAPSKMTAGRTISSRSRESAQRSPGYCRNSVFSGSSRLRSGPPRRLTG